LGETGGREFGDGVNWCLDETRNQRVVFEVLSYDDDSTDKTLTPFRGFFSGTAVQSEYYVAF
jgi:hypothetical protein